MSGTTAGLQRKISSAADLQSVVRSMKALAASSITQYEQAVVAVQEYARTVELGLSVILRQRRALPFGARGGQEKVPVLGAVIFGSDQGLVGRFNEVIVEHAISTLAALAGTERRIWAVGERAHALLVDRGWPRAMLYSVPNSVNSIAPLITSLLLAIGKAHDQERVSEVHLFYNDPGPGASYSPTGKILLPLDRLWHDQMVALPWPTACPAQVIENPPDSALEAFVRGYLFILLFQASAASLASENASRLAAMQRADKNIDEILARLKQTFRRNRQEAIDEELFDVVSGYEALKAR